MFNIDWLYIIKVLIPPVIRKGKLIAWLRALLKPLFFNWTTFLTYRNDSLYYTGITFQKIAMEKMLNDIWDKTQRRIYITEGEYENRLFWANKYLAYPKTWMANKWSSSEANVIDDVRRYGDTLYKCIQAGTGQQPDVSPAYWEVDRDVIYIGNKLSYDGDDFIVMVPADVYATANLDEMKGLIDDYKFGGKRYKIESF